MVMAVGEPSFFKLILAPRLDLQKLGIPSKFMKRYGEELSDDCISLNIPVTDAEWKVQLVTENNKAWLENGWPKFVEFYSINHGHFLVFTYKGNSSFDVFIFDKSTSEIDYPVDVNACRASKKRKRPEAEISTAPPSSSKNIPDRIFGFRCGLTPDEKKRVEDYQCNHISFVVKLKPSQFDSKKNTLNIPLAFARKYLKKLGNFKLLSVTGKTWPVRCETRSTTHVSLTKGWKDFALGNKLGVDDICVFELIDRAKKTFRVGILPTAARETPTEIPEVIKLEDN